MQTQQSLPKMPVSTSEGRRARRLEEGSQRLCIRLKYKELLCAHTPPKTMTHSRLAPLLALRGVWYVGKSAVILLSIVLFVKMLHYGKLASARNLARSKRWSCSCQSCHRWVRHRRFALCERGPRLVLTQSLSVGHTLCPSADL